MPNSLAQLLSDPQYNQERRQQVRHPARIPGPQLNQESRQQKQVGNPARITINAEPQIYIVYF